MNFIYKLLYLENCIYQSLFIIDVDSFKFIFLQLKELVFFEMVDRFNIIFFLSLLHRNYYQLMYR